MANVGGYIHFILFVLVLQFSNGESWEIPEDMERKIDVFAETVLGCRDMVALNLAVVKGNQTVLTKGYGKMRLDSGDNASSSTVFGIASLSKAFTTALLGKLLARSSKYNWDTPVRDILGEDFYFHDALRTNDATLRDLASHRVGINSHNSIRIQGLSRAQLARSMRFLTEKQPFRAGYKYNNLMYGLLSLVTETMVPGKTWEQLMKEEIFDPLGMHDSGFTHKVNLSDPNIAQTYIYENITAKDWRLVPDELQRAWGYLGGTGSVMSTANDMAKWLKMILNGGRNEVGEEVIPQVALEELLRPHSVIPPASDDYMWYKPTMPETLEQKQYALGWRTGFYRGLNLLTHTGTSWGFIGLNTILPTADIAISSSATGEDYKYMGRKLLHLYVADLLMGHEPWINLTTACTFPQPWAKPFTRSEKSRVQTLSGLESISDLSSYEGIYGDFGYGNMTVVKREGGLYLLYGELGEWKLELKSPATNTEFYGRPADKIWPRPLPSVQFSDEEDGIYRKMMVEFLKSEKVILTKDLKMDDAPSPPALECGAAKMNGLTSLLSLAIVFYRFV